MKIQKSLLAVIAMAGTMGFSAVASAMDFSVYGSLRGGIQQSERGDTTPATVASQGTIHATAGSQVNVDADTTFVGGDVTAPDGSLDIGHVSNGFSRLGIRGSEDLGNGAEAGVHWEAGVTGNGAFNSGRHANVWYSGAFGKVTIGQQSNPYRNAANWDQSYFLGGQSNLYDVSSRVQGIRYDGEAGAFNFSVMATAGDTSSNFDSDRNAANGTTPNADGEYALGAIDTVYEFVGSQDQAGAVANSQAKRTVTIAKAEVADETGIDSWIATGHYDMGVATINLGYRVNNVASQERGQQYDNFVISANGVLDALSWYIAFEQNTDNGDYKVSATGFTDDGGTAIADVENANVDRLVALAEDAYALQDTSTIGLFLGYSLSEVSTLYLEWEDTSNDGFDAAGDSLGQSATLLGFSRKIGPNTSFIAEYSALDYSSETQSDNNQWIGVLKVDF